jgi:hypothetical protein
MSRFLAIAQQIGELVEAKNQAYGDSFDKAGDFLRLLYPAGITPEQYRDSLALVRIFDKQMRIATGGDPLGESPWIDIAGYAILGAALHDQKQNSSGESDGRGLQAAMPADGLHESDRHEAPAAEVLLRCMPAKRRPGNAEATSDDPVPVL